MWYFRIIAKGCTWSSDDMNPEGYPDKLSAKMAVLSIAKALKMDNILCTILLADMNTSNIYTISMDPKWHSF